MKSGIKLIGVVVAAICAATSAAASQAVDGSWSGTVAGLKVVFNLRCDADSVWHGTLDSPMQGVSGLPCSGVSVSGDSVYVEVGRIGASFAGRVDSTSIIGEFSQRGMAFPMVLQRELEQEALPGESDVLFGHDGMTFGGTLTMPTAMPVKGGLVLVSGSGSQERDCSLFGYRPFATIAEALAAAGWATLRYDDRGVGQSSSGSVHDVTADYVSDVMAAVGFMRAYEGMNGVPIGIAGHSEGAIVAAMCAGAYPDSVDFLISLAGPGVKGRDLMVAQNVNVGRSFGASEPELDAVKSQAEAVFAAIDTINDSELLKNRLTALLGKDKIGQLPALMSDWYVSFIRMDPSEYFQRVKCPLLAIGGQFDAQVDAGANLAAIKSAAGHARIYCIPKANHLFQPVGSLSGSMDYAKLPAPFPPETLRVITSWLEGLRAR